MAASCRPLVAGLSSSQNARPPMSVRRPVKEAPLPGPRVLFMGGDGDAPRIEGSAPVIPEQVASGENGFVLPRRWVLWRLLSANNRELGRSQALHVDHDLCVQDLLRLLGAINRLEPVISHVDGRAEWTWSLLLDGAPVARSSRAYGRIRECHYSLEQFLSTLPDALVVDDPERMVKQRRVHSVPGTITPLPLAEAL